MPDPPSSRRTPSAALPMSPPSQFSWVVRRRWRQNAPKTSYRLSKSSPGQSVHQTPAPGCRESLWRLPKPNMPSLGSYARSCAFAGCGDSKTSSKKPVSYLPRSIAGSPRDLRLRIFRRPRPFWRNWRDTEHGSPMQNSAPSAALAWGYRSADTTQPVGNSGANLRG